MNAEKPKHRRLLFVLSKFILFFACIAISLAVWLIVHFPKSDDTPSGETVFIPSSVTDTVSFSV